MHALETVASKTTYLGLELDWQKTKVPSCEQQGG